MKIFFDTEFTGLHKNTTLISIGLVTENGQQFYAEFSDYDKSAENDRWIKSNVIDKLYSVTPKALDNAPYIENFHYGDKYSISKALEMWLKQWDYVDTIELVSDCSHYDMVLFCDIFGGAFYLPKKVCPTCYDINQDIAKYYNCSLQEAFDMNREDIIKDLNKNPNTIPPNIEKHNSLYDAIVIKAIYTLLNKKEE